MSMTARQMPAGTPKRASLFHGTGSMEKPDSPLLTMVPLNSKLTGTSPVSTACRNLVDASSQS